MILTLATPADASTLAAFVNAAYRGEGARAGWTHEADLLDGQRTDSETLRDALVGGTLILLHRAAPEGPLSGCVSLQPAEDGSTWKLGMLTVAPGLQGAGLGRRLLEGAEDHARAQGATRLRMTVIQVRDGLIAWYARRGYGPTGETEPFPYGDERFGRPVRPDLHFVVMEKRL